MNEKLSPFRDAIFYRYRQRYTLEMIKLWLRKVHKLSVCISAIARCINKSMTNVSCFDRVEPDCEYSYYRSMASARRQTRNYKRHLGRSLGLIEHYRDEYNYTAREIHKLLANAGVTTSLSSIHRAIRLINERKKSAISEKESTEDVCETDISSKSVEQSHVQRKSNIRVGHVPQL